MKRLQEKLLTHKNEMVQVMDDVTNNHSRSLSELEELKKQHSLRVETLKETISDLEGQLDNSSSELRLLQGVVKDLRTQLRACENERDDFGLEIDNLSNEKDQLFTKLRVEFEIKEELIGKVDEYSMKITKLEDNKRLSLNSDSESTKLKSACATLQQKDVENLAIIEELKLTLADKSAALDAVVLEVSENISVIGDLTRNMLYVC